MARKLEVGDRVLCRFFNTPDNEFYGDYLTATIVEIDNHYEFASYYNPTIEIGYLVKFDEHRPDLWLHRKEIKRRL